MNITFEDSDLREGMNSLSKNVKIGLSGSTEILVMVGKDSWGKKVSKYGSLSKGRNGREWFSKDNKKWYITNEWVVPDDIWSGRNFLVAKRRQAENDMKFIISKKKQQLLDKAVDEAIAKF